MAPWSRSVHAQAGVATTEAVLRHDGALVPAGYEDSLAGAQALQQAIQALVAAPSAEALEAAKKAWLAGREAYGQPEAFRFYGEPVDDDKGPEGRLNAWSLDEACIDAVKGKPKLGIVNDPRIVISKAYLARLNEKGGEENVAAGWHAIEFPLRGQDLNEAGPGARRHENFGEGKAPMQRGGGSTYWS